MTSLKFEAWTYPGSASYEKRFEFSPAGGSGERELSDYSDEAITVLANYARLSDIISSSNRSTIKVLFGQTVIDEFLAERVRRNLDRPGMVDVSGKQRNGWVEGIGVYPKQDIEGVQDWHWGSEDNRIDNPSGEDNPIGVLNQGFEDGTTDPWWSTGATLAIESSTVDTGSFSAKCTPTAVEGGMTYPFRNLSPANFYTITFRFQGDAGTDYQFGASGPESIVDVAGSTTRVEVPANPGGYEAQRTITATGSWETHSITFGTAGDQTSSQVSVREGEGVLIGMSFYLDVVSISGFGIGAEPWQPTRPNQPGIPGVSVLEASQDVSHTDTTWVLKCTAPDNEGCFQGFIENIPGEILTYSVDVRGATAGGIWTIELADVNGHVIDRQTVTLTTAFQTVSGTTTLPDFIPGADQELRLQLINRFGNDTIYFAKASVASGEAAATYTQILRELLEDAQARGTATWLELDADDTQDTLGTSLSPISFSAFTGNNAHMGHVMDDGKDIGYHWRIEDASNAQIITPTGTHVLQVFYNTDGEIEDKTSTAGGDYVFSGVVSEGEVVDRIPPFTALLGLGEGGSKLEDTDATEVTAIGRIERIRDVEHLPESSLQLYLDAAFAEEANNRKAARATILGSARKIPGVDFGEGSKVWWQLGDLLPREARTVRRWTWTHGEPARFEVQGSRILSKEAALAKALDHLLNVLERRRLREGRQGRSSVRDTVIQSPVQSNGAYVHLSRGATQSIASGGEAVSWDTQFSTIVPLNFSVSLPATDITILKTGYYDLAFDFAWSSFTGGGTVSIIRTRNGFEQTVWPTPHDPGTWSATDGQVFTQEVAKGIPCIAGDTLEVFVNPDDASAQTLASAQLLIEQVDRVGRVAQLYAPLILSHGPLAYWRLDETSGTTANDIAGHTSGPFNGTYENTPTLNQAGLINDGSGNAAVDFERSNSERVDLGDVVTLEFQGQVAFSAEGWGSLEAVGSSGAYYRIAAKLIGTTPTDNDGWYLGAISNGTKLAFQGGRWDGITGQEAITGYNYDAATTYYVALTYDGTTVTLYVDGAVAGSDASVNPSLQALAVNAYVGASENNLGVEDGHWDGILDEVALYDRALSATEIAEHYNVGRGVS